MEWKLVPIADGSLFFREERGKVTFEAVRPDDKRGLYKLRLYGRGRGLELGALLPEQGALRLRRVFSVENLAAKECWPVTGGEFVLAVPFSGDDTPSGWIREDNPARLLKNDKILERSASELRNALLRREKGFFGLAIPYREEEAFALTPLFCLAKVERMGVKDYIIFFFREDGVPALPN